MHDYHYDNSDNATTATNCYQEMVAAKIQAVSSFSEAHSPVATTATNLKLEPERENSVLTQEENIESQNTPFISSLPVAAENSGYTANTAATTNLVAETKTAELQKLAAQILLCQTWIELAEAIASNGEKLKQAALVMTKQQRRQVAQLLTAHLCSNPTALSQAAWIPDNLLLAVLKRLTFTIRRIGGDNIEDAFLEHISGCKFVSVNQRGKRHEQWIFRTKEGKNIPVFGIDEILAIARNHN